MNGQESVALDAKVQDDLSKQDSILAGGKLETFDGTNFYHHYYAQQTPDYMQPVMSHLREAGSFACSETFTRTCSEQINAQQRDRTNPSGQCTLGLNCASKERAPFDIRCKSEYPGLCEDSSVALCSQSSESFIYGVPTMSPSTEPETKFLYKSNILPAIDIPDAPQISSSIMYSSSDMSTVPFPIPPYPLFHDYIPNPETQYGPTSTSKILSPDHHTMTQDCISSHGYSVVPLDSSMTNGGPVMQHEYLYGQ